MAAYGEISMAAAWEQPMAVDRRRRWDRVTSPRSGHGANHSATPRFQGACASDVNEAVRDRRERDFTTPRGAMGSSGGPPKRVGGVRGPHFFVVGAAKAGTTAFDAYLRAQPVIFIGRYDMHVFGSDLAWGPMTSGTRTSRI